MNTRCWLRQYCLTYESTSIPALKSCFIRLRSNLDCFGCPATNIPEMKACSVFSVEVPNVHLGAFDIHRSSLKTLSTSWRARLRRQTPIRACQHKLRKSAFATAVTHRNISSRFVLGVGDLAMVDDHGVPVRPLSSRPSDLLREAGVGICHEKLAVDLR